MTNSRVIFFSAGEPSGDLHAASLIEKLKQRDPSLKFVGVGGQKMSDAGCEIVQDCQSLSVMGFIEVIKKLPSLFRIQLKIRRILRETKPDLLILIDYQEFNHFLAKYAHKHGIKTLFYIGPQVWVWRQKRVYKMQRYLKDVAVIFPFECKYYKDTTIRAHYVGHPLTQKLPKPFCRDTFCAKHNLSSDQKIVALMPGSRLSEISRHLPLLLETVRLHKTISTKNISEPVQFVLATPLLSNKKPLSDLLPENLRADISALGITEVFDESYALMSSADAGLVASGTATLEAAMQDLALTVFYQMSPITFWLGKKLTSLRYVSLINIILGKKAVEERLQSDATPEILANDLQNLLEREQYQKALKKAYETLREKLAADLKSSDPKRIELHDLVFKLLSEPSTTQQVK